MTPRSRRRPIARHVLGLAAAIVLVGCSSTVTGQPTDTDGTPMTTSSPDQPPASTTPLADRPNSADISATYDQMQAEVRTVVTGVVPSVVWALRREPGAATCTDDTTGQDGRIQALQPWGAETPIPDEQWVAVVTAVDAATAPYDFGPLTPVVDRPGDHTSEAIGPYGATLQIGTANNTILSVITGCHPE